MLRLIVSLFVLAAVASAQSQFPDRSVSFLAAGSYSSQVLSDGGDQGSSFFFVANASLAQDTKSHCSKVTVAALGGYYTVTNTTTVSNQQCCQDSEQSIYGSRCFPFAPEQCSPCDNGALTPVDNLYKKVMDVSECQGDALPLPLSCSYATEPAGHWKGYQIEKRQFIAREKSHCELIQQQGTCSGSVNGSIVFVPSLGVVLNATMFVDSYMYLEDGTSGSYHGSASYNATGVSTSVSNVCDDTCTISNGLPPGVPLPPIPSPAPPPLSASIATQASLSKAALSSLNTLQKNQTKILERVKSLKGHGLSEAFVAYAISVFETLRFD